jgi:8-oxo-dGTP pyrophosphatase MutT (NUDIX family)
MYIRLLYLGYKIYCFIFRPVRMGVRVLMTQENKVWLVRHTYLPGWFMPGGGLKRSESLDQAARREAYEELGAELAEMTLVGAFTNYLQWKTDHTILFLCKDFKLTGKSDAEIAEIRLFSLNDLPADVHPPHLRLLSAFRDGKPLSAFGEW